MIEKPAMMRQFPRKEAQGIQGASTRLGEGNEPALYPDTKGGQPKTRGRNASQIALIGRPDVASVSDNSSIRIGLLPKIEKIHSFQRLQEIVITIGKELGTDKCLFTRDRREK